MRDETQLDEPSLQREGSNTVGWSVEPSSCCPFARRPARFHVAADFSSAFACCSRLTIPGQKDLEKEELHVIYHTGNVQPIHAQNMAKAVS